MQLYTSYFYMVRFMRTYEIPCSTAVWDPKWFHDFKGAQHIFVDKRGVLNGMRASMFAPGPGCQNLCRGRNNCVNSPESCAFLQAYTEQLNDLDFDRFMRNMEDASLAFQEQLGLDRPADFILLLHEAPDNPCSERGVIQQWFGKYGYPIKEWSPETE